MGSYSPLLRMFDHAVEERFLKPENRALVRARDQPADYCWHWRSGVRNMLRNGSAGRRRESSPVRAKEGLLGLVGFVDGENALGRLIDFEPSGRTPKLVPRSMTNCSSSGQCLTWSNTALVPRTLRFKRSSIRIQIPSTPARRNKRWMTRESHRAASRGLLPRGASTGIDRRVDNETQSPAISRRA